MRESLFVMLLFCPVALSAQSTPERWGLVEELRIGSVDGSDALSYVHALAVSPDRRHVYLGQRQENAIRVFDASTGRAVRRVGRSGAGPGEFQALGRLGWKSDTLVVTDASLQRASLFAPDGTHYRTDRIVSAPLPTTGRPATANAFLTDGTVLGGSPVSISSALAGRITRSPWVQMSRDGAVLRTVAERDLSDAFMMIRDEASGFLLMGGRPLSTTTFLEPAPDGSSIVVVHAPPGTESASRFRVVRLTPGGDTLYHRTYRYTPRPVPQEMIDSIRDEFARGMSRGVPLERAREIIREQIPFPFTLPPVTAVVQAKDGSVWLQEAALEEAQARWLVLDPEGILRATVRVPVGLRLLHAGRNRVWGTVQDELDVPYVIRYRVTKAARE